MDTSYINEIKEIGGKEAKELLADYAKETFNISLKKTKSFENMVVDFETAISELNNEPMPEQNDGLSTREMLSSISNETEDEIEETKEPEILIDSPVVDQIVVLEAPIVEDSLIDQEPEIVNEVIQEDQPKDNIDIVEFDKNYSPTLSILGSGNNAYCAIQYWIFDWIKNNHNWKDIYLECKLHDSQPILKSLVYYINRYGSIKIRESRNSEFHILT